MKFSRVLLFATTALCVSGAAVAQRVAIGTSNPGSIYHSSGTVLAKLLNEKAGIPTTIQPFASPNVFIPSVDAGEIQLGFANVAELSYAVRGTAHFQGRPQKNLRAVAIAYPLRTAMFVRKNSDIRSIADLKGRNGVDGFTAQKIILPLLDAMYATANMTRKDVKPVRVQNVVAGADAFAAGRADMFFFAIGAAKPREVDAKVGGIRMLSLPNTPEAAAQIREHYPVGYLRLEKPSKANTGVLEPSYSLAYDALVFAAAKTADDIAYKTAKTMYENAAALGKAFPPYRLFDAKTMSRPAGALEYHPGAIKFYKEVGIWPSK